MTKRWKAIKVEGARFAGTRLTFTVYGCEVTFADTRIGTKLDLFTTMQSEGVHFQCLLRQHVQEDNVFLVRGAKFAVWNAMNEMGGSGVEDRSKF
jgi:hypothetical protein